MASAFGHVIVALALGNNFREKRFNWKVIFVGVICTIIPDIDVIAFNIGVPYDSFWGHRGFSHSILCAVIIGICCAFGFSMQRFRIKWFLTLFLFFFLCTVSHSLLDALTNGGLGVAFFSPLDDTRYFLPWRPIAVSPIGAARFFSERGLAVLKSEALWVGLPCLIFWLAMYVWSFRRKHD